MENFKVICKGNADSWFRKYPTSKVVTTSKLFGLFKSTKVVSDREKEWGPSKDEICIVTEEIIDGGELYYVLAGYPNGSYDSKLFIRLDEFTETQKEIAEKVEYSTN